MSWTGRAVQQDGNAAVKRGDFQAALAHYDKALHLNTAATAARSNRALCFLQLGRFEEALVDCDAVLSQEPRNVKALLRRAQACAELGRRDEACSTWQGVLDIEPGNAQARRHLDAASSGGDEGDAADGQEPATG